MPRKPRIDEEVLRKFYLDNKDRIISSKRCVAPKDDPIWDLIAHELGDQITANRVYMKACEFRDKIILNDEEIDIKPDISTIEYNDRKHARLTRSSAVAHTDRPDQKPWQDTITTIFVNRKNEILPMLKCPLPMNDPIWPLIAAELDNAYSYRTLHNMVVKGGKFHHVLFPPDENFNDSSIKRQKENKVNTQGAKKKVKNEQVVSENGSNLLAEIQEIVTEDSLMKLLKTTDRLTNEIKELNKINNKLYAEMNAMKKSSKLRDTQILNEIHIVQKALNKEKET